MTKAIREATRRIAAEDSDLGDHPGAIGPDGRGYCVYDPDPSSDHRDDPTVTQLVRGASNAPDVVAHAFLQTPPQRHAALAGKGAPR